MYLSIYERLIWVSLISCLQSMLKGNKMLVIRDKIKYRGFSCYCTVRKQIHISNSWRKWNCLTKEQNQIISSVVTINRLKDGQLKLGKRNKNNHSNWSNCSNNINDNSNNNNPISNKNNENKSSSTGRSKSSERFKAKWAWKKFPSEKMDHIQTNMKRFIISVRLIKTTKHNTINSNLLKNMKLSDDKDTENDISSTNSNAVWFAAQMETVPKKWILFTCLILSKLFFHKEIQLIITEIVYW